MQSGTSKLTNCLDLFTKQSVNNYPLLLVTNFTLCPAFSDLQGTWDYKHVFIPFFDETCRQAF
jgi:hypothetical protein